MPRARSSASSSRAATRPAAVETGHRPLAPETLLIAIGNSGRGDDGLGWVFADRVRQATGFRGPIEYRYQRQVEDAELVSRVSHVVFVDACAEGLPGGFEWRTCRPAPRFEFSTHELGPGTVLKLCRDLYGAEPGALLLAIEGRNWALGAGLSRHAQCNLKRALEAFGMGLGSVHPEKIIQ